MFSFTNKKVMGVWSSEVKCIKWMEKSDVIKNNNAIVKYRLISYHFTSVWYHFYLFLVCIDFTDKYKEKQIKSSYIRKNGNAVAQW